MSVFTTTAELETTLMLTTDLEPTPMPTTESKREATSFPELKVAAQSDQVCVLTSTYEPVGNREEPEEDDSLLPLIPPSPEPSLPLTLPNSKTNRLLIHQYDNRLNTPILPSTSTSSAQACRSLSPTFAGALQSLGSSIGSDLLESAVDF